MFLLILVALIQGVTEFLPVSSSGHLILLPNLTGLPDQGLLIDVAVHVGTLFAVIIYFWRDVSSALFGLSRLIRGQIDTPGAQLAFLLIIATIPLVIAGFIVKLTGLDQHLRSVAVVGWAMLIFGFVLYWADQNETKSKASSDWSVRDAIVMGLFQVLALIPGASRSGVTITAGRRLGYSRESSAKLAMLMSIPAISASAVLLGLDVVVSGNYAFFGPAALAAALAFGAALAALSLMMRLLKSISFTPYVLYRTALGLILLYAAYA